MKVKICKDFGIKFASTNICTHLMNDSSPFSSRIFPLYIFVLLRFVKIAMSSFEFFILQLCRILAIESILEVILKVFWIGGLILLNFIH